LRQSAQKRRTKIEPPRAFDELTRLNTLKIQLSPYHVNDLFLVENLIIAAITNIFSKLTAAHFSNSQSSWQAQPRDPFRPIIAELWGHRKPGFCTHNTLSNALSWSDIMLQGVKMITAPKTAPPKDSSAASSMLDRIFSGAFFLQKSGHHLRIIIRRLHLAHLPGDIHCYQDCAFRHLQHIHIFRQNAGHQTAHIVISLASCHHISTQSNRPIKIAAHSPQSTSSLFLPFPNARTAPLFIERTLFRSLGNQGY
jgi:hypothetical protein